MVKEGERYEAPSGREGLGGGSHLVPVLEHSQVGGAEQAEDDVALPVDLSWVKGVGGGGRLPGRGQQRLPP